MRMFKQAGLFAPRDPQYESVLRLLEQYKELELEIGAGQGQHCLAQAQAHPDRLVIGVERTRNKYLQFKKLIEKNPTPNLIAVNADIVPWIVFLDKKILFKKIWILYPNPEIKSKNRRWVRSSFFPELLKRLKPNSEIEFATNLLEYAMEIEDKSLEHWKLISKINIYNGPARSQFEKKYLEREQTCYQVKVPSPTSSY
jgi:tRNA (guanine-N7-)-methyltransferase